jgi:hypothetical protein
MILKILYWLLKTLKHIDSNLRWPEVGQKLVKNLITKKIALSGGSRTIF